MRVQLVRAVGGKGHFDRDRGVMLVMFDIVLVGAQVNVQCQRHAFLLPEFLDDGSGMHGDGFLDGLWFSLIGIKTLTGFNAFGTVSNIFDDIDRGTGRRF